MNEIEFAEKTRLKRSGASTYRLPILKTDTITRSINGKKEVKTYTRIKADQKDFVYADKTVFYGGVLENYLPNNMRFEMTWVDLITPQDLLDLQDNDYNAFGVFLPKKIILEVLDFHKNHDDEFSLLVREYPFVHIVFLQWLTIKLYERHKELINNPKLEYRDFMKEHFSFTYDNKLYDIYQAIEKMKVREFNNRDNVEYSLISSLIAVTDYEAITLYDFIYDIIPNSIKDKFLSNDTALKAYLPLKQDRFEYKEYAFYDKNEIHKSIYGETKPFNDKNIKKEWYSLEALNLKGYKIEFIVPKAKINKLGIGYDEIWELVHNDESSLTYPEIYDFKLEEAPELEEYEEDEEGNKMLSTIIRFFNIVISGKHKTDFTDIIQLTTPLYLASAGFREPPHTNGIAVSDEIRAILGKQHYTSISILQQNNFTTKNRIFESLRQKMKQLAATGEMDDEDATGLGRDDLEFRQDWYGWTLQNDAFNIYRLNQALAIAFLNAYEKEEKYGI